MKLIHKYAAMLLIGFVVPMTILGVLAYLSMKDIEQHATQKAADTLEESEQDRLFHMTLHQAHAIDDSFAQIESDVDDICHAFEFWRMNPHSVPRQLFSQPYEGLDTAGLPAFGYVHPDYGVYADFEQRAEGFPWLPRPGVERVRSDPDFRDEVTQLLFEIMLLNPQFYAASERHGELLDLVWIVLVNGLANDHPPFDHHEAIAEDPDVIDLDESTLDYVYLLDPEHNPERRTVWLDPYFDRFKRTWMTSCVAPLYEGDRFWGTTGMDLLLSTVRDVVLTLDPGPNGYAFLISSTGTPIALPERGVSELLWEEDARQAILQTYLDGEDQEWTDEALEALETLNLVETPNEELRALVQVMTEGREGTAHIQLGGESKLLAYAPISKTGWSLGVVTPLRDVVSGAEVIAEAIHTETTQAMRHFFWIAAVVLLFGVAIGIIFILHSVRPLSALAHRVEKIRWDQLSFDPVHTKRKDEIGELYSNMEEMIALLRKAKEERELLDRELGSVQRVESLGVLAGGIAHDFNNFLTAILGNVSLAAMKLPEHAEQRRFLVEAERACERARELTQQLLTFSKGGAPQIQIFSLPEIVAQASKFALRGLVHQCNLKLSPDLWPVKADPGQISRVINNLVINASQAMSKGGTIRITAGNEHIGEEENRHMKVGSYVRVTVSDGGEGIAEDALPNVFDPFFTTKKTGTGLGLSVCFNVVQRHGGHIEIESVPGKGTNVSVWLPAAPDEHPRPLEESEDVDAVPGRVLVMDDEEQVLDMARRALSELGYKVEVARSGDQAVNLYRRAEATSTPIDLVILDLTVRGGMGGVEAAQQILKINGQARLIVSSGYSSDEALSDPVAHGFQAAVLKPYDVRTLGRAVAKCLGNADSREPTADEATPD